MYADIFTVYVSVGGSALVVFDLTMDVIKEMWWKTKSKGGCVCCAGGSGVVASATLATKSDWLSDPGCRFGCFIIYHGRHTPRVSSYHQVDKEATK